MSTTDDAGALEALLRDYIETWNARDAGAVWSRFYRLDPGHAMASEADVRAYLAALDGQGYAHTVLHSVEPVLPRPDKAVVTARYTRLKTDGAPMPPEIRTAEYHLRRFPDGWRMTRIRSTG